MVKFTGTNQAGQPVLGLGLSRGNLNRLLEGKPIVLKPADVGLDWTGEIVIFAGQTEQAMIHMLSRAGVLRDIPVQRFDESKEQSRD